MQMGRAHRIINNDRRTGSLREFDYLPNILLVVAVCQVNIVARVPVAGTRDAESLGSTINQVSEEQEKS